MSDRKAQPSPVILTRRGVLHRQPAWESCNIDDSEDSWVFLDGINSALASEHYRRPCKRCYPDWWTGAPDMTWKE